MNGLLVADLGLGPEVWLLVSVLGCITLFFKFGRFWSVRNFDLLLLFALVPGMMQILTSHGRDAWGAYLWLFAGSAAWLVRCVLDLGLSRRPFFEPNLSASGLLCLLVGILGLLLAETVSLPVEEGAARNPAEPAGRENSPPPPGARDADSPVNRVLQITPLPPSLKRELPQVILSRVLAMLAHLGLVLGLVSIGWAHFEKPILGMAMGACYLIVPYTRMALVDSGQLVSAALIVAALVAHNRPLLAGALIGLAAGWIPACLGLIALWAGYYRGRGSIRFLIAAVSVAAVCAILGMSVPPLSHWASALGARSIAEVGLLPWTEPRPTGSFWLEIASGFRIPVLVAYLALVIVVTFWPARKNLGELIALSAALLVASQFWYLDKGGTLVMLYLPLVIAITFRPTMPGRRRGGAASVRASDWNPATPSP